MDKQQLEHLIERAANKVAAKKTSDICRYIPVTTGGHIHHFTMWKMAKENPHELSELIAKYIILAPSPQRVTPKPRASRGSRRKRDSFTFSRQELEKMLQMARMAKDTDIIRKLTPRRDLRAIKRELIASIRHGAVEQDLWILYSELVCSQHPNETEMHASANNCNSCVTA